MPRSGYKHWHNDQSDGQLMFVTTTCLDFAPLFARHTVRSAVAKSILSDFVYYAAPLYAYVVMPHHIHLVVQAPDGRNISWLMQRIKTNSAKIVRPLLTADEIDSLSAQTGLDKRTVWMRSFHGLAITDQELLRQKAAYVHDNPIRAELCVSSIDYPWSSARASVDGTWDESSGLALSCMQDLDRTLQTASLEG